MKSLDTPPQRLLMGPGPSNVPPQVLAALGRPMVGHLDPFFQALMNELQQQLRTLFQTTNRLTLPMSGTGSSGMEAAVVNFVEPGDRVLVGIHGVFGQRIAEIARRCGAECTVVEAPFGTPLDVAALREAADRVRPELIAFVHAETSTGVLQPVEPIREIADRHEALLLVDAVTSLGGMPLDVDGWRIDICYSGTQKCLSCPPGLAPLTVSEQALARIARRTAPCPSWYLDLSLVQNYWGEARTYHHTAPISMNYALLEAVNTVLAEGLPACWERHRGNHQALIAGLEAAGLSAFVEAPHRLWTLNTVTVPDGVDEARVRAQLLEEFNLEIGGGLGELAGRVWRVGLMGHTSRRSNVVYFLTALAECLRAQGHEIRLEAGLEAAAEAVDSAAPVAG